MTSAIIPPISSHHVPGKTCKTLLIYLPLPLECRSRSSNRAPFARNAGASKDTGLTQNTQQSTFN